MKELAGIELEKINVKSIEDLDRVGIAFAKNYNDNYFIPDDFANAESIISPLRSYIKWRLVPTRDDDQRMAMIIRYLPNDEDMLGSFDDNFTLLALKLNLRAQGCGGESGYAFRDLAFKERCDMVAKHRRKICFHKDWKYAVASTSYALHGKLFSMASENLDKLSFMSDRDNKTINKANLPAVIALQISCYITIMRYLHDKIYDDYIHKFYCKIEKQLIVSLNKLKKLPEHNAETKASSPLTELFFFYKNGGKSRKYNQVSAELTNPLLSERRRRFFK